MQNIKEMLKKGMSEQDIVSQLSEEIVQAKQEIEQEQRKAAAKAAQKTKIAEARNAAANALVEWILTLGYKGEITKDTIERFLVDLEPDGSRQAFLDFPSMHGFLKYL